MRIALLGSFPIYPYRDRLKVWDAQKTLTTPWNVSLAKGLAGIAGNEVHVFTNAPTWKTQVLEDDGVVIHFIGHLPKLTLWDYWTRLQYSRLNLHRLLKKLSPDIVHGSGML